MQTNQTFEEPSARTFDLIGISKFAGLRCAALSIAFLFGCAPPPSVKTPIAGTALMVALDGPDEKQHYRYSIFENGTVVARRFLGPAKVDLPIQPKLSEDGHGRVTVRWGSGRGGAFTSIDTKARVVVEDTNLANPSNESFRTQP